jgi:hypothetical protein
MKYEIILINVMYLNNRIFIWWNNNIINKINNIFNHNFIIQNSFSFLSIHSKTNKMIGLNQIIESPSLN